MVLHWHLTFLWQEICFPYICMGSIHLYGKNVENSYLDISSIIQLNRNLMMSIRVPLRHKIAKWADRKSKMATTAAILKISFRHLFSNLWSLWAETCSLATGWLLDQNKLKLCCSKIQVGRSGSAPLNKMAARAKKYEKIFKQNLVLGQWPDFKIFAQKLSTKGLQPKLLKWLRLAEQMAARAKNRKTFKRHLLCSQCPDFKVISQKYSSYGLLPKLLKCSAWLNKMATRAKNRKKS